MAKIIIVLGLLTLAACGSGHNSGAFNNLDGAGSGDTADGTTDTLPDGVVADLSGDVTAFDFSLQDLADGAPDSAGEDQLPLDLGLDIDEQDLVDLAIPDLTELDLVQDTGGQDATVSDLANDTGVGPDLSGNDVVSDSTDPDLGGPDLQQDTTQQDQNGPAYGPASHITPLQFCTTESYGFKDFGVLANGFLDQQVSSLALVYLLELRDVANPDNTTLNWYNGESVGDPQPTTPLPWSWLIDTASKQAFDTVFVGNVAFDAKKSTPFDFQLTLSAIPFNFTVHGFALNAQIGGITADGFDLSNGKITGLVTEDSVKKAVTDAKQFCLDQNLQNAVCLILGLWDVNTHTVPGLYDTPLLTFDKTADGKKAAEICFDFASVKGKITGASN